LIPLAEFAPDQTIDPVDSVKQDLYGGTRSATFHSKVGRPVILPRDVEGRAEVLSSLERVGRLYLALAGAVIGARRPRSSLSSYAFRESSSVVLADMGAWASAQEGPLDPSEKTFTPNEVDAVFLPMVEPVDTHVPYLVTKLAAADARAVGSLPFIRRLTGVGSDGSPMMAVSLEERLVAGSATRLEVQFGLRNRNDGLRTDYAT